MGEMMNDVPGEAIILFRRYKDILEGQSTSNETITALGGIEQKLTDLGFEIVYNSRTDQTHLVKLEP
jgi:hypothetical protein